MFLKVVAVNKEFKEEKRKQELENKYSSNSINEYAFYNRNSTDKEIEKVYNEEDLKERFNITLEDFKIKCEEEFKNYERTFDEHDDEEFEIEEEDYEDEEEW